MVGQLKGKVAIVTGASRGIGKATAIGFAREGAAVVIAARTEQNTRHLSGTIYATADEIKVLGGKSLPVKTDVSSEESVANMVAKTLHEFGKIDILVNNAAVAYWAKLEETPLKRWDLVMRVNLYGTFLCCRGVLPTMIAQKAGSIINVSSLAAEQQGGTFVGIPYCVSKAAIERFTTALAEDVKKYNVAVNCVKPYMPVETEGMRFQMPKADFSSWTRPEQFMVKAMLFLAGQSAGTLTGGILGCEPLCVKHGL